MNTLELTLEDLEVTNVEFVATDMVVTLRDGRRIATPLAWYPKLERANPKQRSNYKIMRMGISWPDLDEDIGIAGMLAGNRAEPSSTREYVPKIAAQVSDKEEGHEVIDPYADVERDDILARLESALSSAEISEYRARPRLSEISPLRAPSLEKAGPSHKKGDWRIAVILGCAVISALCSMIIAWPVIISAVARIIRF